MTSDKAMGWLQLVGGVAALFMQIWGALHGTPMEAMHAATAAGLTLGGAGTVIQADKLKP